MRKLILILLSFAALGARAQQYEVLPHSTSSVRGHLGIMDGLTYIQGSSSTLANRYGLTLNLQIGPQHRFDIGWVVIDVVSSGEHSPEVGSIERDGSGPTLGYFLIPDRLSLHYTFESQSVRGSRISDSVTSHAHQLAVAYRFYMYQNFSLSAQMSYLYAPRVTVPVLDIPAQTVVDATYPAAQIMTLGLVIGLDTD
jgi:hypothetical protein